MLLIFKDFRFSINKILIFKVLIPLNKFKVTIFKIISLIFIFKI
jgi:hypothetical protein